LAKADGRPMESVHTSTGGRTRAPQSIGGCFLFYTIRFKLTAAGHETPRDTTRRFTAITKGGVTTESTEDKKQHKGIAIDHIYLLKL